MSNLRLVSNNTGPLTKIRRFVRYDPTSVRRFKTDYSGSWCGFCKTRESAITAAAKNLLEGIYSRCTIIDLHTGHDVARLHRRRDGKGIEITVVKPLKKLIGY